MGILDKIGLSSKEEGSMPPRRGLGILLAIKAKKDKEDAPKEESKSLSEEDMKELGEELFKKFDEKDAVGFIKSLKAVIKVLDED